MQQGSWLLNSEFQEVPGVSVQRVFFHNFAPSPGHQPWGDCFEGSSELFGRNRN